MFEKNLIFVGPPGSGKGTQAVRISEAYQLKHVSTGELFREHIGNKTQIGLTVAPILQQGEMVPNSLVNSMVEEVLFPLEYKNFVLDGHPRSGPQAQWLFRNLEFSFPGKKMTTFIFQVSDTVVRERLLARKREGETEEVINRRITLYKQELLQLLDVTKDNKDFWNVRVINASKDPDAVYAEINKYL